MGMTSCDKQGLALPRQIQQVGKEGCPDSRNRQKAYSVQGAVCTDTKGPEDSTERITRKPVGGLGLSWPTMKSWWYALFRLV